MRGLKSCLGMLGPGGDSRASLRISIGGRSFACELNWGNFVFRCKLAPFTSSLLHLLKSQQFKFTLSELKLYPGHNNYDFSFPIYPTGWNTNYTFIKRWLHHKLFELPNAYIFRLCNSLLQKRDLLRHPWHECLVEGKAFEERR